MSHDSWLLQAHSVNERNLKFWVTWFEVYMASSLNASDSGVPHQLLKKGTGGDSLSTLILQCFYVACSVVTSVWVIWNTEPHVLGPWCTSFMITFHSCTTLLISAFCLSFFFFSQNLPFSPTNQEQHQSMQLVMLSVLVSIFISNSIRVYVTFNRPALIYQVFQVRPILPDGPHRQIIKESSTEVRMISFIGWQ